MEEIQNQENESTRPFVYPFRSDCVDKLKRSFGFN